MDEESVIAVLKELLSAEERSLAPRLLESTVFVSDFSVAAFDLVQRMAQANRGHGAALAKLIFDSGGIPSSPSFPVTTADLHFQELQHALPRLIADQEALVRGYTIAAQRLSDDPRASAFVTHILQRHQQDLQSLRELSPARHVGAA